MNSDGDVGIGIFFKGSSMRNFYPHHAEHENLTNSAMVCAFNDQNFRVWVDASQNGGSVWLADLFYFITRGMNKKYHVTAIANVHARIAGNKVMF